MNFFENLDNRWDLFAGSIGEIIERGANGFMSWLKWGGWHRIIGVIVLISFMITIKWICERLSKLWQGWGD